jgi:hypothetical protein
MRYTTGKTVGRGVGLALVGMLGLCVVAEAQILSYAVKFVCGARGSDGQVVSGIYATTVNVHNPQPEAVKFRKKAVISLPQRQDPGPIAQFVEEELRSDGALGMDCRDIRALFPAALPGFIEGFVVIHVALPQIGGETLDVVGVYTARHRTGDGDPSTFDVETIDVEEVRPKRIPGPVD